MYEIFDSSRISKSSASKKGVVSRADRYYRMSHIRLKLLF
jgi:hypothetical protein